MPTLMRQINVVSRCGARYRAEEFKRFGLSAPHHSYILNICKNPGISQEQLAEHICVDKSNVTRQLALLEELGQIPSSLREKIMSQQDANVLTDWLKAAAAASSLEDFRKAAKL